MNTGGQLSFVVQAKDDHIVIDIADTGSGIQDNEIGSIYDPFVTSKTTGVGLGLTMVHQIIINHDGEISIKSIKNEGTFMKIKIPFSYHDQVKKTG